MSHESNAQRHYYSSYSVESLRVPVSTNSYTCYQITASNNHLVPTSYSKYGFILKHYICTVFYNPRAAFSFQINSKVKRKNSPSHESRLFVTNALFLMWNTFHYRKCSLSFVAMNQNRLSLRGISELTCDG